MALNAPAFGRLAARFHTFAMGDTPLQLTPVGGGTAISFIHDQQGVELMPDESGGLDTVILVVMTQTLLATAAQYTWGGETWTVKQVRPDYMGSAAWPHRAILERHAR